jgi:hypothetical protein
MAIVAPQRNRGGQDFLCILCLVQSSVVLFSVDAFSTPYEISDKKFTA